jgi:hypothetical protein
MGVEVWMPKSCELLKMPLYAYEAIPRVDGSVAVSPEYVRHNIVVGPGVPESLHNTHKGETAVIMGNGPSLSAVPRELLGKYPTFGVNHVGLLPFQPTCHVVVDENILKNFPERVYDAAANAEIAFIGNQAREKNIPGAERLYALPNVVILGPGELTFPGETAWTGWTSVYVALKIAYYMGFETVLLVGVDHGLKHFSDDYPVSSRAEELGPMRLAGHRKHFALADAMYKANNRGIINLSPPSDLDEILERGDIKDWL